ncbi:MAG: ATP-binding protein [Clostridia bacterium]|nr:ATP-binding protein [Clostridia bacterium]
MRAKLSALYKKIQAENRQKLEQRREHAYSKSPRFLELDSLSAEVLIDLARGKIDPCEAARRNQAIRTEQEALLKSLFLPPTYLDMRYICPNCKDTGLVGTDIKRPCACYLKNEQQFLLEGARINNSETFENFSTDIYPEDAQRFRSQNAKKLCERYANSLPAPKPPCLLLHGQAGLGKSFFGNAIAYRAIENGIPCIRITAYRFIQDIMEGLSARENRLDKYVTLPLLVLDDIGIEPMIPNITRESLLSVLGERQGAGLATVYITNLSYEEIGLRYSERFASRLFNREITLMISLTGEDLRKEKR